MAFWMRKGALKSESVSAKPERVLRLLSQIHQASTSESSQLNPWTPMGIVHMAEKFTRNPYKSEGKWEL